MPQAQLRKHRIPLRTITAQPEICPAYLLPMPANDSQNGSATWQFCATFSLPPCSTEVARFASPPGGLLCAALAGCSSPCSSQLTFLPNTQLVHRAVRVPRVAVRPREVRALREATAEAPIRREAPLPRTQVPRGMRGEAGTPPAIPAPPAEEVILAHTLVRALPAEAVPVLLPAHRQVLTPHHALTLAVATSAR